jgi:PAS domain S-box-containing protein
MKKSRLSSVLPIVIAIAAAVGLLTVNPEATAAIPSTVILVLSHLTETALVLLCVSLFSLWMTRPGLAVASAVAAMACLVLEIAYKSSDAATPAELLVNLTPSALAALIALGVLTYSAQAQPATRFFVLATSALGGIMVPLALLIALSVASDSLAIPTRLYARLVGVGIVSGGYTAFLAVAPIAPPSFSLRWLRLPIGAAGIAGVTSLLVALAATGLDDAGSWAIAALFAAGGAGIVGSLIGICSLGAIALDLSTSNQKARRSLRRQRRLMQSRTRVLRQSQKHYKELFRSVQVAVLLTHPSGMIIAANPAMLELLGVKSEDELRDVNFSEVYADPDERQALVQGWHSSTQDLWKGEVRLKRRDGAEIIALYVTRIVRGNDGEVEYHQGMFTDVTALRRAETERRALEMHLRLSQKLESVGRLAVGIAHEINTPMQYLGDNVYFLQQAFETLQDLLSGERQLIAGNLENDDRRLLDKLRELEDRADLDYTLQAVPQAFRRTVDGMQAVNRIVAAIKELAHPVQRLKVRTDVNALLTTALVVTSNEYKTVAEVETCLGKVPPLLAHKNELCQVFINLIVNATHAIESAKRMDERAGTIRIETASADSIITVRIIDNGCGIPQTALDKIFDPFFTTKEVGKGTGQGLAIATRAISNHGGRIEVESRSGVGSTFTIHLPAEQTRTLQEPVNEETA